MLLYLINTLMIGSLFVEMLEKRYPKEFKDCLMQLSYNCIYLYSKFQISANKFKLNINKLIENNPMLSKIKNDIYLSMTERKNTLHYVKDSEVSESYIQSYDFKIYSCNVNNVCYKQILGPNVLYDVERCLSSDIKFMLLEFIVGENKYKIDLKTDEYNYYVVGNTFDKNFFIYYLKHHLNISEKIEDDMKCTLKIIDHDINELKLDFTDKNEYILLEKNEYKLRGI